MHLFWVIIFYSGNLIKWASINNEVLGITNNLLNPSDSKIYEKELRCNETSL